MARRILSTFLLGLVVSSLIAAGAYLWGYAQFTRPGPSTSDTTIVLPRGDSLDSIARRLAATGVISGPDVFILAVRLKGLGRQVKAGEYRIVAGDSMERVLARLTSGEVVVRLLTVPEGLTTVEVLGLVRAAEGLTGEVGPAAGEGQLLPETYYYEFGDSRAGLVERMRQAMRETVAEVWARRLAGLPLTAPEQAVVLASLIEKETGVKAERARVASVFINRLRRDMRLQSDPTVAYALTHGKSTLARALSKADLSLDSPYNTYRVKGLPPAPIANPGRAALLAAVRPLDTKELYFVADGTGGHSFATTFKEHSRNVRRWRRIKATKSPN